MDELLDPSGARARGPRRRPGRPGRDAAREPARAGHLVLRRAQARRDPGADQHRLQGRVPPPPARRLRRQVVVVQGDFAARVAEVAGAPSTPELAHVRRRRRRPTRSIDSACRRTDWDELLAGGADRRRCRRRTCGRRDLACFIYTAGTTGPSKGCMLPHNYVVAPRRPDRPGVAAPRPTTSCSPRCRCSTSTRSRCASSARCSSGGRAAIERALLGVAASGPRCKRTGATMRVDARVARDPARRTPTTTPTRPSHTLRLCAAAPMPPDIDRIWQRALRLRRRSAPATASPRRR